MQLLGVEIWNVSIQVFPIGLLCSGTFKNWLLYESVVKKLKDQGKTQSNAKLIIVSKVSIDQLFFFQMTHNRVRGIALNSSHPMTFSLSSFPVTLQLSLNPSLIWNWKIADLLLWWTQPSWSIRWTMAGRFGEANLACSGIATREH